MAAAAAAAASFDSLGSAPTASALQIFYATTNHTLPYARVQACSLTALDLRGTALAWDEPSYNALSPHANLPDASGAWDAPPPWHPHPKMCKVLAAHRQEECRRAARGTGDADGAPLSAFGPAGRRLGWMRLYALARLGARLPGQPLVLADADVAWLRSDAPRPLLETCAAGFDAAFVRDAPSWSHVGLASGGLVLSCGTAAAARLWRDLAASASLDVGDDGVAAAAKNADAFSSRLLELYAGNAAGLDAFVGARAGAYYPPPSDQTMLNYELALAHATGRARVAVLNSSIFVAGATLPAARGHEAAEAEAERLAPALRHAALLHAGGVEHKARMLRAALDGAEAGVRCHSAKRGACPTSALRQCARHLRLVHG